MGLKRGTKAWDRFWSKVKRGPECWEWQAGCSNGYGKLRFKGLSYRAHRVSYAMGHEIPEGLCVLHTCDNPPCVRPSHLFLGTQADNAADRVNKGRQAGAPGTYNGRAKLTEGQVKAIRCDSRTQRGIAKAYGISHAQVGNIKQRKCWRHID